MAPRTLPNPDAASIPETDRALAGPRTPPRARPGAPAHARDPLSTALRAAVDLALEERIADLARPTHVNQRTVAALVGLERFDFMRAAKRNAFPSAKVHRLIVARVVDVEAWLASQMSSPARIATASTDDAEARALARVGARRVGGTR